MKTKTHKAQAPRPQHLTPKQIVDWFRSTSHDDRVDVLANLAADDPCLAVAVLGPSGLDVLSQFGFEQNKPLAVREKVRHAVWAAEQLARKAVERHPDTGLCGWARVVTYVAGDVTHALVEQGLADDEAIDGGHAVKVDFAGSFQSLEVHQLAAQVAADHLTKTLGQDFLVISFYD